MTTFSLHTEIHTGDDAFDVLARFRDMRVLIVTDAFLATTEMFRDVTARLGSTVTVFDQVEPNPTIHLVGKGTACYLAAEPEVVIALGGGSPIDAAKAMHKAALTVGKGAREGLVAIPTTSGSGSEVTSYAVITDEETHAKLPMVSPDLRPRMAILDPRAGGGGSADGDGRFRHGCAHPFHRGIRIHRGWGFLRRLRREVGAAGVRQPACLLREWQRSLCTPSHA